jgi:hypothetical protein
MGKIKARSTDAVRATKLAAGMDAQFAKTSTLSFASSTFTQPKVVAQLQLLVSLRADVDEARAALAAKLAAERAQLAALKAFMNDLTAFLMATFSRSPDVLATFGLAPRKTTTPTVQTLAAAAAKREATRKARGTMGSRQRRAVKGAVTGVVVTPVVAGPAAGTPHAE